MYLTMQDMKRAKKALDKANIPMQYIPLDTCNKPATPAPSVQAKRMDYICCPPVVCNIPSAKEDTMTTIQVTEDRAAAESKRYLNNRLYSVFCDKERAAETAFNITPMESPKTVGELMDRLSKGLYVIKNADQPKKDIYYGEWSYKVEWRDPSKPADEAGYKAFVAKLHAAKKPVEDAIAILPAVDALKILQAFETTDLLAN